MALEELAAFVEAVDRGSLTGAARALRVPKSTISRRIQRLEEEVGQALLQRNARVFRLTEAGEALYQRAAPGLRDVAEAFVGARDHAAAPAGDLRVTAPTDLGATRRFVRLFTTFRERFPAVRLHVDLSDRMVDLVAEGVDVGFRAHQQPLDDRASLRVRRLARISGGLYAAPTYLALHGRPRHADDLAAHTFLAPSLGPRPPWRVRAPDGSAEVELVSAFVTNSVALVRATVEAGGAIGVLPSLVGDSLVDDGRAERVLPDWAMSTGSLSMVWPASRQLAPRVRAFLDHAVDVFATDG